MSLHSLLAKYWGLVRSLSKKIILNSGYNFILGCVGYFFSQCFLVLAFFLPLKVLILVSGNGIPHYLIGVVNENNKNDFIIGLAIGAIVCYLLYLICDYTVTLLANISSEKVQAKAQRLSQIANTEEFSKDIIARIMRSWATYFMVLGGFLLGLLIEWRIFSALIFVLGIEYLFTSNKWRKYTLPNNINLREKFLRNRNTYFTVISSVNFFIGFCLLFLFFYNGLIDSLLVGIFLILLIRQISQRLQVLVNDGIFLYGKEEKILSIFYVNSSFTQTVSHQEKSFIEIISPENRKSLIDSIGVGGVENFKWEDLTQPNVALFSFKQSKSQDRCYWVKLYSFGRKSDYAKELEAYKSLCNDINMPFYECTGHIDNVFYILLSTPLLETFEQKKFKKIKHLLFKQLWMYTPSGKFTNKLQRSITSLNTRFTLEKVKLLRLAINDESQRKSLEIFEEKFETVKVLIDSIPMCVVNGDLSMFNTRVCSDLNPILINWNKIAIEPICSHMPSKILDQFGDLGQLIEELKLSRDDCDFLTDTHLRFIGLIGELDRCIKKRHFNLGLKLIIQINEILQDLEKTPDVSKEFAAG
jgi:hypothetical protein